MKLPAKGRLRHRFHGDYSAVLVLEFEDDAACALALPALVPRNRPVTFAWQPIPDEPRCACIIVESDALEILKARLGELGADVQLIDSVAKSIDYGEPFTLTVEAEDPAQCQLPLAA